MYGSDTIRALLVGDSPQSFSLIRQLLEKSGCECHFAGSLEAVKNLLRLWQFDVVLSTHGIPSYAIQTLIGLLLGSGASLFSSLRVEEGSWWLPVLQSGKECYGLALTVGEFARALDDLKRQILIERLGQADSRIRTIAGESEFLANSDTLRKGER
jgi:CheY-like chemotaxis protein